MKAFGSGSMKRTMLLTNAKAMCRLGGRMRIGLQGSKRLCRKYVDSRGRPRFAGTRALKRSQKLGSLKQGVFQMFFKHYWDQRISFLLGSFLLMKKKTAPTYDARSGLHTVLHDVFPINCGFCLYHKTETCRLKVIHLLNQYCISRCLTLTHHPSRGFIQQDLPNPWYV